MNALRQCRVKWAAMRAIVLCFGVLTILPACEKKGAIGSEGGEEAAGRLNAPADPSAIQGEWVYLRVENEEILSGDCITIADNRVTKFINSCRGEDMLRSSEEITTEGDNIVLKFSINLPAQGDAEAPSLDINARVVANGELFVGEERGVVSTAADETIVYEIALRSPEGLKIKEEQGD